MNTSLQISMDQLPTLRVLVVDDNRTNLQILQVFLKKLGHSTISAENGEQAVNLCTEQKPDLILLDIMMPVMDGFEAARQIRAQASERWIPIIFLSALDRNENLVTGLEAGGDDFMSKPINFVVLEAKMRSMQRMLLLQRKAVEALKRIQVISDNVLDAIVTIDTQATIIACNASCERIFGWEMHEMIGQNVSMLMPEPFHSEHDGYVRNYVQGGPPQIIGLEREVTAVRRDGSPIPIEIGVTEMRFEKERLFVGVLRDISERKNSEQKLRESAEQLRRYQEQSEVENQLARSLIDRQLQRPGLRDAQLRYLIAPAQNFSGDVVAAARSPDGKLYALLVDATGRGLSAVISTLPVLSMFYRMAPLGVALAEMVGEMNGQLRQSMPAGHFLVATLVCIDAQARRGEVWIGGTAECMLLGSEGQVSQRFVSQQPPLGSRDTNEELVKTIGFSWDRASQLVICSDGLLDATNRDDVQFGVDGLLAAMHDVPTHLRHDAVRSALARHLDNLDVDDDVALLLIDCPAAN